MLLFLCMNNNTLDKCPFCEGHLKIQKVRCAKCGIAVEGEFRTSRLALLSWEEQQFIEMFVLASGSLKEMAKRMDITYPTVRSRLDHIIASLKARIQEDDRKNQILDALEKGEITADKAAELLRKI